MPSQLRLSTKLIMAFGLLIIIQIAGNCISLVMLGKIDTSVTDLESNWLPSIDAIAVMDRQFQTFRRNELIHVLSTDDAAMKNYDERLAKSFTDLNKATNTYEKLISSPEERQTFQRFQNNIDKYMVVSKNVLNLSRTNQKDEAKKLVQEESRTLFYAASEELAKLVLINKKGGDDSATQGRTAYQNGKTIVLSILIAATLLGVTVCLIIIRGVNKQLGEDPGYLHDIASRIAAGEMDLRFKEHTGEGGVFAVLKLMVANLKQKIAEANATSAQADAEAQKARDATLEAQAAKTEAENAKAQGMLQAADRLSSVVHVVSSASEQLSAQIEQSTQGAEHQSQRLSETATAMEEMNATVLEVARNASQATDTAEKAKDKAQEGAEIVNKVVGGIGQVQSQSLELKSDMTVLGKQAEDIGQIMNVISDIADQTNLLALNAAIEAARAGEAGRGFAVVADEVRKLAEKTMTATKEVGDAIQQIQHGTRKNIDNVDRTFKTIEDATAMAKASGEALSEIVRFVDLSTDQVRAIATASEEQSSASEEINRSVEEVNRIAAETMDALRQSAQAVSELAQQAQELGTMVQEMQDGGGTGSARAALPASRTRRALR
ncbi:chemotaxis protein [Desulfovibrio aerotolerans]|uniref:Chemotaxis protein n=1 Tax=Solidesulfovibrio aerotolerans TaxID=295255 RepID=A0A7C9MHS3_9BACT|nr:methyl-accepting chemotaxis protein [Solidesulfovibrio aerotolerans]MYL85290.1 chemotaxis protein [Solidesulfovibrio aerotolerans]